jgi:hypothetical protein
MGLYYADGPCFYRSSQGGSLVITSTQRLLALRVFGDASSGFVSWDIGGTFTGEPIPVSSKSGFDWTPSGKYVNTTFTFSSTAMQWFAEIENLVGQ